MGGGSFTSDQVVKHAAATGTLYTGRSRVTSITCAGIANSTLTLRDGGGSGTVIAVYKFGTEGLSVFVPGSGILFKTDVHATITANANAGVTVTLTT
jgi:hypothetical protein|tara:strand:+ start:324 stop:614 length:291 start_codon:yes stop_codon:yes gene_type:complete